MAAPADFIPDGAKPEDFKADPPTGPSIFETTGQKLKRIGKAIAPSAAAMGSAITGSEVGGALGGPVGAVAGAAVGGAAAPFAARGTQALVTGEPYQGPSTREVVKSAVTNAAWTGVFAGLNSYLAGSAKEVAPEIESLPAEMKTHAAVTQAMQNRDFWQRMGLDDQQITETLSTPGALQQAADDLLKANRTKQAFQTMLDANREDFNTRYTAAGTVEGKNVWQTPVDARPIGESFEKFGQGGEGQHELTPSFRGFLQRKGLELTQAGESGGPSVGGVPWKQLPEKLREQIRAQGGAPDTSQLNIEDLRDLRTELRENVPTGATNLDKQAAAQLNQQITTLYEDELRKAGTSSEQVGAIRAIDEDYARWSRAVKTLDPRSTRFGDEAADKLFSPMFRKPDQAVELIKYAQKAEDMRPGEVMPQFKSAFLDRAIQDVKTVSKGDPLKEAKAIGDLARKWGGDKNTRVVLKSLFGDSPMSNPDTMRAVVGSLSNPDIAKAKMGGVFANIKPPAWLVRLGVAYSLYSALTGSPTGPWTDMHKNPARFAVGMTGMIMGTAFGGRILTYGETGLQNAYVNFVINPNATNLKTFGEAMGAANTAIINDGR
jgi:hypothetical protein